MCFMLALVLIHKIHYNNPNPYQFTVAAMLTSVNKTSLHPSGIV
jgi:hypothetical protein